MFISKNAATEEGKCGSCELKGSDGKKYRVCVAKASVGRRSGIGWTHHNRLRNEIKMHLVLTFSFVDY